MDERGLGLIILSSHEKINADDDEKLSASRTHAPLKGIKEKSNHCAGKVECRGSLTQDRWQRLESTWADAAALIVFCSVGARLLVENDGNRDRRRGALR